MKIEFYHTFNFPDGENRLGQWDLNGTEEHLKSIGISGKTILDTCCRDGWYGFQFEKMGGIVTGLDLDDRAARRYAAHKYCSKNTFIHENFYQMAEIENQFKIVFAGDCLCHVDNPLKFLKIAHGLCIEKCVFVCDLYDVMDTWDKFYIWKFTKKSLFDLFKIAGFQRAECLAEYELKTTYWKHKNGMPINRNVGLFVCEKDSQAIVNLNEKDIIPKLESILYRQELTYEIDFQDR